MRIVYIADDGKEFDDEYECKDYEWKLNYPHIENVRLYGKHNKKLGDIFSEKTYCEVQKIIISDEKALNDFQDLAKYTGFCCYEDIIECGEWKFSDEEETFVKK